MLEEKQPILRGKGNKNDKTDKTAKEQRRKVVVDPDVFGPPDPHNYLYGSGPINKQNK
jgi:hypothetical protein